MLISAVSSLPREAFTELLGGVFEHSPWVAERAFAGRPFANVEALHAAMCGKVAQASAAEQLALLRAHPDLGTRARVSASSADEQAGVGLNRLSQEEFDRLTRLNAGYREKFGFPFLYAVKGSTKAAILEALQARAGNNPEDEFQTALEQVYRIARFRLEDLITS